MSQTTPYGSAGAAGNRGPGEYGSSSSCSFSGSCPPSSSSHNVAPGASGPMPWEQPPGGVPPLCQARQAPADVAAARTRPPWLPTAHLQLGDVKLRESDGIRLLHRNANADSGAAPQYAVDMRQGAGSSREWGRVADMLLWEAAWTVYTTTLQDKRAAKERTRLQREASRPDEPGAAGNRGHVSSGSSSSYPPSSSHNVAPGWPPPPPPPPAMTYTEPGCGGSWVPGPIAQGSSVGAAVAGSMGFNPQAASSVNPMPCQTTGHWQPGSHRDTAAYPSGFNHWQPDAGTYALPGSGCQQPSVAQPLQQEAPGTMPWEHLPGGVPPWRRAPAGVATTRSTSQSQSLDPHCAESVLTGYQGLNIQQPGADAAASSIQAAQAGVAMPHPDHPSSSRALVAQPQAGTQ